MALAKVAKINLIAHRKFQDQILEVLQNLGFIQIDDYQEKKLEKININERITEIDYQIAGVKFSLDFLANYETAKKSLAEKLNPKIILTPFELERIVQDFDYQKIVQQVQELESKINEAKNQIEKANLELAQLKPWQKLDFIPSPNQLPKNFNFKLITANEVIYQQLANQLQKQLPISEIQPLESNKKEVRAVIIFQKAAENKLTEILTQLNLKFSELPELEITVEQRLKDLNRLISEAENKWERLDGRAQILATQQKNLKIIFDYLSWQKEKLFNQQKTGNSWQTFALIGWLDEKLVEPLKKEVTKITDDFLIEVLPFKEEESAPIIFRNSWAKPFEAVTSMYGAPQYHEPDPTPFLAPFFLLFFSLCLTDAGYGIILAIVSWLAIKILKLPKENQKLLKILMFGGIITFIAGSLTGGWFGAIIDNLKLEPLRNLLIGVRIIDPVKEPIKMLIFCLALGVIQVLTGIIISLYWKVRNRDFKSALLGETIWLYFIFSILFWLTTKLGLVNFAFAKYLVWVGAAALILTQGREAKNPILKLGMGIISLYGLIGYISDVLSYSRLLALGLATGIIAMVINLIARIAIDLVPYLGWLIAALILIGGHTFNLAINVLGAFIHSSRLQFVEFFPKFMEGGGKSFQPFQKESKYIIINK